MRAGGEDRHRVDPDSAAAGRASLEAAAFEGGLKRATGPLLGDGYAGACEALSGLPAGASEIGVASNDLAGHQDRLAYAARLRWGQSISRGMVEGMIEPRVNPRWRVEGVGTAGGVPGPVRHPEWAEYGNTLAA